MTRWIKAKFKGMMKLITNNAEPIKIFIAIPTIVLAIIGYLNQIDRDERARSLSYIQRMQSEPLYDVRRRYDRLLTDHNDKVKAAREGDKSAMEELRRFFSE